MTAITLHGPLTREQALEVIGLIRDWVAAAKGEGKFVLYMNDPDKLMREDEFHTLIGEPVGKPN